MKLFEIMKKLNLFFCVLMVIVPFAALAAQAKMDPFDLHVASLRVLERKDVQAEIGVTTAQRAKMDQYAEDYNNSLKAYIEQLKKQKKANQSMPDGTVIMMLAKLKQNVMAILTPGQLKRLREISLQAYGLNGILDTTVAKKVGLSEAQITKMEETYKAGSKKANDLMMGAMKPVNKQFSKKPKDAAEEQKMKADYDAKSKAAVNAVMPNVQKVNDDTQQAMLAIFTPQQRQAFLTLQGKVFHSNPAAH